MAIYLGPNGKLMMDGEEFSEQLFQGPPGMDGVQGPPGGEFPDAPHDGNMYVRCNGEWYSLGPAAMITQNRNAVAVSFDEALKGLI